MIANIFKGFGRGILYFFLFPFILIGVSIYAVVGLGVFVVQFIKMVILFFTGRTLSSDLEEDITAKAILGEITLDDGNKPEEKPLSLYPSDSPVYGSGYSSPLFPENKQEATPEPEPERESYLESVEEEEKDNDY